MLQVAQQYNPPTRYHDTDRMMTMMLPNPVRNNRKQNKSSIGQSNYSHSNNHNSNNHYEQEERKPELLPDMIESPSGSIETIETFSSGGGERRERERDHNYKYNSPPESGSTPSSPLYSSSSRMHQRFAAFALSGAKKHQNQSSQSPRRTSSKKDHHRSKSMENEPSNSSIMMGADIIRRQLSGEQNQSSPMRQASPKSRHSHSPRTNMNTNTNNKTNKNISPQHALNSVGRTSIDKETWDPFLTEEDAATKKSPTLKNRIIDLHNSPTKNRQHRVQEILSAGDTYFGNKAAAEAKAAELRNRKPKEQTGNGNRSSNLNCMVQRLSEIDDSTFASSSDGNGYLLPNSLLMSGLTCGGLNNTLTTCANPQQQLANSSSPLAIQPAANPLMSRAATETRSNISDMYQHIEDEFETSTLDFLANLHTKEEDLNFVFDSLENEQVHLCAQSGIPAAAQSYFEQFTTRNVTNHNENQNQNNANHNRKEVSSSSYVTAASIPFEKMLSSRSSLHEELLKDPAYRHALKAGTLWQSLCSQHVRFPAHWWDGQEPVGPPLGSSKKQQQGGNSIKPWSYLGRHRVRDDAKLGHLIGNRASSGRLLLHLLVRDDVSGDITEDIACGCYHPNARGVRTARDFDPTVEDCRDVWIAHRRRVKDHDHERGVSYDSLSTIESLLKHQNKNRIHESPLGAQGGKHSVNNKNMRTIFGSKPPVFTIFCTESELFELFQNKLDGSIPASVVLLRRYLGYDQMS